MVMSHLDIFLLALVPGIGMGVSALVALWRRPSPTLTSIFQYFTAGVILAATVSELLPDLDVEGHVVSVAIGFSLGVALMLTMREFFESLERPVAAADPATVSAGSQAPAATRSGTTFAFAVGTDLFVDGMLLGLALAVAGPQGTVFLLAVTLEVIFLGVSAVATLLARGVSRPRAILVTLGLGALIPIAALLGAILVALVPHPVKIGFLAFGIAALLYLVVEELLLEAHHLRHRTSLAAATFFLGFLIILLADGAGW